MRQVRWLILAAAALVAPGQAVAAFGDATIESKVPYDGAKILIRTSSTMAGAINSLVWKGVQFIKNLEHGTQLQVALQYDNLGGDDNPTEAGSAKDKSGRHSSSLLIAMKQSSANSLKTVTQMAYWIPYAGNKLSTTILAKNVTIGWKGLNNVVSFDFTLRVNEPHSKMIVEAPTGYLAGRFNTFYTDDGNLRPLVLSGFGKRTRAAFVHKPVIACDPKHDMAMGIISASVPDYYSAWYIGRNVAKWNATYSRGNVTPGTYHYEALIVVGTLEEVHDTFNKINTILAVAQAKPRQ